MDVRLDCPFCATVVAVDEAAVELSCRDCGARGIGGTETPLAAVSAAAEALGGDPGRVSQFAAGLFSIGPDHPLSREIAITSDHREGFYRWWVVVAAGADSGRIMKALAAG